ncbi:unnamed protein product [Acanthoscelides obtectus]|uniref:Uncharacterized protein n=1 Tax=Acanthoscelides obtectus TaxID=200917 RepID=A0A9P0M8P4_ACAOB|nr:unnamed protein product [Acanthoscelides obtectus]CAK1677298.1 hypothetical protein AOBTE_LOCUS31233 [Acanthoscelides obtectus]
MCILDWQASVVRSPVYDLAYFLYSTCSTILDRVDELLREYHDSFSDFIRQLGSSPELFTFEDLQRHWKKYSVVGVTFLPFLLKLILIDENDAPDFGNLKEGEDVGELMNVVPMSDKKQYFERAKAAFAHHAETCMD